MKFELLAKYELGNQGTFWEPKRLKKYMVGPDRVLVVRLRA